MDPDRAVELEKKLDTRRIMQSKQNKYKRTRITRILKVTDRVRSNSRVPDYKGKHIHKLTLMILKLVGLKRMIVDLGMLSMTK